MLTQGPSQLREVYCSKAVGPVSRQPSPWNLMFLYISAAVSLLWVRSFQNLLVLGKRGCVFRFCRPALLSVGGLPAHFVSTQLAGPVAISLPSDQPRPSSRQGGGGLGNTRPNSCGECQNKSPCLGTPGPSPQRTSIVHCATSLV